MNTLHGRNSILKNSNSIEACCNHVAKKLNKENYQEWKNADYKDLSAKIHKKTKINISENTLKRFFGKLKTPDDYQPQKATRDALAVYIGFANWEDFESFSLPVQIPDLPTNLKAPVINPGVDLTSNKQKNTFKKLWAKSTIVIVLLLILSFSYFYFNFEYKKNVTLFYKEAQAYSSHSAIFKLRSKDGTPLNLNDYHIFLQGWKNSRMGWKDSTLSYYYEKPGVYYPVLYHKNIAIDTATVTLLSKGWDVTVQMQNDTVRLYPIFQVDSPQLKPPIVKIMDLHQAGVDTLKPFFVNYSYVKNSAFLADNISIEADVLASVNRPGIRCSQVDLTIYGTKGSHYFSLMKPECIAWSCFKFGENIKSGKNEDLYFLGHDLSKGGKIRLEIRKQKVAIFLNQKQIFKTQYDQPIGGFMGVNFMFGGIGKVDSLIVKSL